MLAIMPTAMADCVAPQGRYIGTGAGPASLFFRNQLDKSPQLYQGVMTTTFFLDFSGPYAGKYRYVSDFAGPVLGATTMNTPAPPPTFGRTPVTSSQASTFLKRSEASIGSVSISSSRLDNQAASQGLDPVTCTASMGIRGVRYSAFSPLDLSKPMVPPESGEYVDNYSMTVSQNGGVITLIRDNTASQPNTGFSIRLERQ